MKPSSPSKQLAAFMTKYTPEVAAEARAVLARLRKQAPGAIEMVYDNYNALVIGFGATDRPSEAVLSVVLFPKWITLCFIWGVGLPDPKKLLQGKGNQVRTLRLASPKSLDEPAIRELISLAIARSKTPFEPGQKRRLIIKSISAKQRPRRPKGE